MTIIRVTIDDTNEYKNIYTNNLYLQLSKGRFHSDENESRRMPVCFP